MIRLLYEVWTDGSCKPKSGKKRNKKRSRLGGYCGIGIMIKKDGKVIEKRSKLIQTINDSSQAEYEAFIRAINLLVDLNANSVLFHTDSLMIQKQMIGEYTAHSTNILEQYTKAKELLQLIPEWKIVWVPRRENVDANKLASDAIKRWVEKQSEIKK